MKKNYALILFVTALALMALLVSQVSWFRYASNKDIQENDLIVLSIRDSSFHLARLDTFLATRLNVKGNAEDEIEIPNGSYLIKAEYQIKQPSYPKKLGVVVVVSIIGSFIIIFALLYLLLMLNRQFTKTVNMERSFHGAIHDLKSPLAYVFFQLSLMEEEETDMTKKTSLSLIADRINFLTDKIMRSLKSVQNINKVEEKDKEEVFLYDMLELIESEMHTMFPQKEILFKNKVNINFTICVLPDLMEASIRIIIENAVKFNGETPAVEVAAIRDVKNLRISISDNGIGISTRQIKNIFKPNYTSDKVHGIGIGLHYAQNIVKAHGGNISITSKIGEGSTFLITLPNT